MLIRFPSRQKLAEYQAKDNIEYDDDEPKPRNRDGRDGRRNSQQYKMRHESSEKTAKRLLTPAATPTSVSSRSTAASAAPVVLGKAVPSRNERKERMHSTATDLLAPPDEDIGRASTKYHANYAFKVALYAEEIQENVPAIVVWRFKKGIFLRLSTREPRFRADRGFYADTNTACTQVPRPYYGFNVVKLHAASAATNEPLPEDMPTPRNARRFELVYRMHYDESGRVRSVFELRVVVHATRDGGLLHLRLAQMRLKGQEHVLGERNLETLALQSPTDQPTLMFTPQLFRNIATVPLGSIFLLCSWQRRLNREVWTALGQLSDRDWTQFNRIRQHFNREYRKKLEASNPDIDEEFDDYTEVDA